MELRDTTSDPQLFSSSLEAARQNNPHGLMVSGKSVEELSQPGTVTFMSPDNMAGALVTADGDIEAVFKNPKSAAKGARSSLLLNAINNGGTKLDCYGQGLVTTLYDLAGAVGKEEVVGLQPTSSSIKKLYEAYQERGAAGAVSYAVATSQIVPTGKVSEITGEKGTTNEDFYRAYFGTSESVQNQAQNYLTKVNDEKGNEVYRQFGAAAVKEWVRYKTTVDLDKNGGITQTEAEVWLKHSNLTQAQKAWFWKNTNKRWEDRSNPFI